MNKSPDPRIFIGLAVAALLVGAGLLFLEYGQVGSANAAVAAKQAEVDKAESVTRDLDKSKAAIADLQSRLDHLEKGVQDYQYIPYMLKDLEQFGNQNGMTVLGVRTVPQPAQPTNSKLKKNYDQLSVEIKGRGTYANVQKFLTALKQFPQIVGIHTLSLNPKSLASADNGSPLIDMTAEVLMFVFPDKSPSATPDKSGSAMASTGTPTNG